MKTQLWHNNVVYDIYKRVHKVQFMVVIEINNVMENFVTWPWDTKYVSGF